MGKKTPRSAISIFVSYKGDFHFHTDQPPIQSLLALSSVPCGAFAPMELGCEISLGIQLFLPLKQQGTK